MIERIKRLLRLLLANMLETYYIALPFGTFVMLFKYRRAAKLAYAAMSELISINDNAYKTLSEIGFAMDDEHCCLKALIDRGKVAPDTLLSDEIRFDAESYINEKLRAIRNELYNFDLLDSMTIVAEYDAAKDAVLIVYEPFERLLAKDAMSFLHANIVVTVLAILVLLFAII